MKPSASSSLRSTIRPEGRPSDVAVASVIAFGSFNSAACASSIQRRNCPIGFGSQFTSSSAPRLYSSRRSSSDKETTDSVGGPAMALVWHPLFDWYTRGRHGVSLNNLARPGVPFPDYCCVAAKRQSGGSGGRVWRHGFPNGFWSSRHGNGTFQGDGG